MKNVIVNNLFAALLFVLPFTGFAQASLVGNWTAQGRPDEQGKPMPLTVVMKADGTYTVDFGADGKIDVEGKYTIEGDQITLEDNVCVGKKGVFKMMVTETTSTLTVVDDPCERSGPPGKIVLTRVK